MGECSIISLMRIAGAGDMTASRDIARLIELMAALRTPGSGCPWDLEQSFATIAPYTIEEAYEVAEAIARGDLEDLREELGDLLLQVAFHARMAEEAGAFDFGDVVHAITAKLVRRHPHVFGDTGALPVAAVNELWDRIKGEEKAARAEHRKRAGADPAATLAGVPTGLPALRRALKLQEQAGKVGFDWNDARAVLAKIREEADEIESALALGPAEHNRLAEEVGERRFAAIERALAARGKSPQQSTLTEMDALWDAAKAAEREENK